MKNVIDQAVKIIKEGGVILYPTDTVWGLGCDPNNEEALQKINAIKKRIKKNHFILLVNSEMLLNRYVKAIPEVCYDLIDFANSPLTIIYPKGQYASNQVLGDDGSIAIRMVKNEFCDGLMKRLKHGIVSTSANISGEPFPTSFQKISADILDAVDFVVPAKYESKGTKPSQIIKIGEDSEVNIIRK